jgi:PAS domain S-box-containing protein
MSESADSFFESLCRTVGFALISADRRQTIRSWNDRAAVLFGRQPAAMIGTSLWEAFPDELRPQLNVFVTEALERQASNDVEFTRRDAAGNEQVLVAIISPVLAPEGTVLGVSLAFRDITPRRRAIVAVRDTAARLKAIFENAAEGIVTVDEQGRIESFNPAAERIFGYSAEEAVGRGIDILLAEPYAGMARVYLERASRGGAPHALDREREVVGRRKSGETFPLNLAFSETVLGERQLFTGIVRDLTIRKRLDRDLAESQRMAALGKMANDVSDHFNNILAGVLTSIEAALSMDNVRAIHRLLERTVDAIGRAKRITSQLMAFGGSEYSVGERVDLSTAVRQYADALRPSVEKRGVSLVTDLQPIPAVSIESHRLLPILEAISQNAVDAMQAGGTLTIRLLREGDAALIRIEDTGTGISPENLSHMFEPFFTTKRELHGAAGRNVGMGLAAVRRLVTDLGGRIDLESQVGVGTTVSIHLPLAKS